MEHPTSPATRERRSRVRTSHPSPSTGPFRPEDFPGCESFHLPAREIDLYDRRLEFWDGQTETAFRACDVSLQHEGPSRCLVQMATRVASLRGSPIQCLGSSGLARMDERGRKRWPMQADEVLYVHPVGLRLSGPVINVDEDPLPDVALEVNHTTDASSMLTC